MSAPSYWHPGVSPRRRWAVRATGDIAGFHPVRRGFGVAEGSSSQPRAISRTRRLLSACVPARAGVGPGQADLIALLPALWHSRTWRPDRGGEVRTLEVRDGEVRVAEVRAAKVRAAED